MRIVIFYKILWISGCSAVASALALGARCRGFDSRHPDHFFVRKSVSNPGKKQAKALKINFPAIAFTFYGSFFPLVKMGLLTFAGLPSLCFGTLSLRSSSTPPTPTIFCPLRAKKHEAVRLRFMPLTSGASYFAASPQNASYGEAVLHKTPFQHYCAKLSIVSMSSLSSI